MNTRDEHYTTKVDEKFEFSFNTGDFNPDWISLGDNRFHLIDNNKSWHVSVLDFDPTSREVLLEVNGTKHRVKIENDLDALIHKMGFSSQVVHKAKDVKAPMPGTVLELFVEPGQEIHEGDKLLILEAMKMENVIKAPGDGTIKEICVQTGNAVNKNEVLVTLQ